MASSRNSAAWLVLAAVLTLPSFMFFRWWSQLKSDQKAEMHRKVRSRLPAGQMFGQPSKEPKLSNPMSAVAAPSPAATAVAAEPAPVGPGAVAQPAASALAVAAVPAAAAAAAAPAAPAATAAPAYDPDSLLKTDPISQIVLTRDPMLSPFDLVRIKEAEERTRLAREEIERSMRPVARAEPQVRRAPPIDSLIELQGIISTDNGDKAIVNGEVVGEGDNVGEVRVLKISPSGVVFLYNKKRYIKGVSK